MKVKDRSMFIQKSLDIFNLDLFNAKHPPTLVNQYQFQWGITIHQQLQLLPSLELHPLPNFQSELEQEQTNHQRELLQCE